jgi:methyl-accepting chemotaxis protein
LGSNAKFIKGELEKRADLPSVRQTIQAGLFKKTRWAIEHYMTFRVSWEDSRPRGEDRAIMPIRVIEYLTPQIVLDGARNARIAEALPGIFVALGIWGTFLGLVLGLKGLKFDQLGSLQQGVGHLISGLTLSFLTSLGGILFSIVFLFLHRFFVSALENALFKVDGLLAEIYPYNSNEGYVRKFYELQADVKQGLQTLATDVATSLGDIMAPSMGEALETHLVPVMKELHLWIKTQVEESRQQQNIILGGFGEQLKVMSGVITDHFENSQQKQSEAMEAVLRQYVQYMNDNFGGQFEDMRRVIEKTTQAQQTIRQELVEFTNQLHNQFQAQSQLIDKTNRAGEILGQSLESLESIAQKLKSSADDIVAAADLLERSADSAKQGQEMLKETMERQIQTMEHTRESLSSTWQNLTENAHAVVEHVQRAIDELAKGVGEHMTAALETFDGKVAEIVERFSGTLFEAGQTMEEMPGLLSHLNESLGEIGKNIGAHKEVLEDLKTTTKDLVAKNVEEAVLAAQGLKESTENIVHVSQDLKIFFEDLHKRLSTVSQAFAINIKTTNESLEKLTEEVTTKVGQSLSFFEKSAVVHEELLKFHERMDQKLSQQSKKHTSDITESIAGLGSQLDSLKEIFKNVPESGDGKGNELLLKQSLSHYESTQKLLADMIHVIETHLTKMNETTRGISATVSWLKASIDSAVNNREEKTGLFRRMLGK